MYRNPYCILVLPLLFLTLNCGNKAPVSDNPSSGEIPQGAEEIPFETLYSSSQSGMEAPTKDVLDSQSELNEIFAVFNSKRMPNLPVPEINFDTHEVFVYSPGQISHGVPSPSVRRILKLKDKIVVALAAVKQNESGYVTTVISEPCVVVAYEKTSLPVVVQTEQND